jgi:hypothetical protein
MLMLAHQPDRGPEIIKEVEGLRWFQEPSSISDEYARTYCRYVAAAVQGDLVERAIQAEELGGLPVKSIYRHALRVT